MNDLHNGFMNDEITHDDFNRLWSEMRQLDKQNEVINHFEFSEEQWATFDDAQKEMLHHAMDASQRIEDLQYQLDEFIYWAENVPSY